MNFTVRENALLFWLWAFREFHWTQSEVDDMLLADFLDYYVLTDKIENPDDYRPGEFFFHP